MVYKIPPIWISFSKLRVRDQVSNLVPAKGTRAIAAASAVSATAKSSGSRFQTSDLPLALASVCNSNVTSSSDRFLIYCLPANSGSSLSSNSGSCVATPTGHLASMAVMTEASSSVPSFS